MPHRSNIEPSRIVRSIAEALRYLNDPSSYYTTVTMRCYQDTGRSITGTPRMITLKQTPNGNFTIFVEGLMGRTITNDILSRDNILNYLHSRNIFCS